MAPNAPTHRQRTAPKSRGRARGIRRVALTCDLSRLVLSPAYRNLQLTNLRWLCAMLGAETDWPAWGVEVVRLDPARDLDELTRQCAGPEVLADYAADAPAAWARRFDATDFDIRPDLVRSLGEPDLVVGFELPPSMKRVLQAAGLAYLSFNVHPLRFLPDLCLSVTSNRPQLLRRFMPLAVPESAVVAQVNRFRALTATRPQARAGIPEGWAWLAGQTARDAIVIDQGRFVDWSDHSALLASLLAPFPGCVLLQHPHRADSDRIAHHIRALTGRPVLMTNANSYGLIFSEPRSVLLTLASSLGVEAQAAGVNTRFLIGDPRQRVVVAGTDAGNTPALGHQVLDRGFWKSLFEDSSPPPVPDDPFGYGRNHMRDTLDAWSYFQLQTGLAGQRARHVLFPVAREGGLPGWLQHPAVEPVLAGAPVGAGDERTIDVADPWAPLLLEGFHAREPWGAWQAENLSHLAVGLGTGDDNPALDLCVQLTVRVFHGLLDRCPVCRISHGQRDLALLFFRPGGPEELTVELEVRASGPWLTLSLLSSDTDSPHVTLRSDDTRRLGVGLVRVQIRARAAAGAEPEPLLRVWGVQADGSASPAATEPQA
jgi:hypothetical protein